jgi:hypothetical protein
MKPMISLLVVVFSFSAFAQEKAPASSPSKLKKAPEVQKFDMEDEVVDGDMNRPLNEVVQGKNRSKFGNLIKPRINFVPEMLRSVHDI